MNKKFSRRAFPYMTEKELAKYDPNKQDDRNEVRRVNNQRHAKLKAQQAEEFTKRAKQTRAQMEQKNVEELDKLQECIRACNGDQLAGTDMYLYNSPEVLAELNDALIRDFVRKGSKKEMYKNISYLRFAAHAGREEYARYVRAHQPDRVFQLQQDDKRALLTTVDDPGAANTVDTTLAQNIVYRAQSLGKVMPLLDKIDLPYGDYEEPYYNKYGKAGYLTETGTIPDFNTSLSDATDGIKKTKWTPRDFALGLKQSFRSLTKLSPSIMANIFSLLQDQLTTGMEYQALSGPGTGETDTGMITGATSITAAGNAYLTFVNARSDVESKRVRNLVAFMNAKAWGEYLKLRVTNEAYRASIRTGADKAIDDVPVVIVDEEVIATVVGTPNTAPVVVGDPKHYLIVTNGTLKEWKLDDPENLERFTAFHMSRDGAARFADSYATFSINVV